jgi:hypothetical protein
LATFTRQYWTNIMAPAMQFDIPEPMVANAIRASQVHCFLAARTKYKTRIAPWIGSLNYGPLESESQSIIRGMAACGQLEFARRANDYFVSRYNDEGFVTPTYTVMGTGWQLWTLGEFYRLTRDHEWMKRQANEVARVCRWVMLQRSKTVSVGPDGQPAWESGLMPPGAMADWEVFAFYFYMNGYFEAGLEAAGRALTAVGHPDGPRIQAAAADFGRQLARAFRYIQSQAPVVPLRDGSWVPYYPSQLESPGPIEDLFPGEDAGRSWCYDVELGSHHLVPFGVLAPDSREARWMMDHMEDVMFLRSGWHCYPAAQSEADWFNLGGFAKVQPYYARTGEIYALQDEVKPFLRTYFNTFPSLMNGEDLSLWEHFFNGAFNKTHETGYFLHQSRLLFVMERGDALWLAPFVPASWMKSGQRIAIRQAPTAFGPVAYEVVSRTDLGRIEARVTPPKRNPPNELVLRLRHPEGKLMKSIEVNGRPCATFEPQKEIVRLKPGSRELRIVARY